MSAQWTNNWETSVVFNMIFNHESLQPEQGGMPWGKEMVTEALLPALLVQTSRWKLLGFAGAILILCKSRLNRSSLHLP